MSRIAPRKAAIPTVITVKLIEEAKPTHPASSLAQSESSSESKNRVPKVHKNRLKTRKTNLTLNKLGLPFNPLDSGIQENQLSQQLEERESGDDFHTGSAFAVATNKTISQYKFIHQRIDQNLTYPSEFIERGFAVPVVAKVCFDRNGYFSREDSKFESSNPFLKIHVIRVLKKALADPIPASIRCLHRAFCLNSTFHFYFTMLRHEKRELDVQETVIGKNLYFYRSHNSSILKGENVMNINPVALFESVFGKKQTFDPLQKYRDDPEW